MSRLRRLLRSLECNGTAPVLARPHVTGVLLIGPAVSGKGDVKHGGMNLRMDFVELEVSIASQDVPEIDDSFNKQLAHKE
jgi:hypothetical protein